MKPYLVVITQTLTVREWAESPEQAAARVTDDYWPEDVVSRQQPAVVEVQEDGAR